MRVLKGAIHQNHLAKVYPKSDTWVQLEKTPRSFPTNRSTYQGLGQLEQEVVKVCDFSSSVIRKRVFLSCRAQCSSHGRKANSQALSLGCQSCASSVHWGNVVSSNSVSKRLQETKHILLRRRWLTLIRRQDIPRKTKDEI